MAQATNRVGNGSRIDMIAGTAAISARQVIIVRTGATGMIGVAIAAAAATKRYTVDIDGVWVLPKTTGTAHVFAVGDIVYWDVADDKCQGVASANIKAGICVEAAVNADTTMKVKLIPSKA